MIQSPKARRQFQLYYITDRSQLGSRSLDSAIAAAVSAGVDWVQIREKDLAVGELLTTTQAAVKHARHAARTRIVVNDRLDVALAGAAHGVHLGRRSMPPEVVRRLTPPEFVVGVSCHSLEEAAAAEAAGADYILLGPIFPTPSKLQYGPPLGLGTLGEVAARVSIPVLALGGITPERAPECSQHGAAGIAGIRLFQDCASLEDLVRTLRRTD